MNANVEYYKKLISVVKELLVQTDSDSILSTAMDHLIEISGAERGIIILFDGRGEILFETARKLKKKDIEQPEFEVSRTIIEQVRSKGASLCPCLPRTAAYSGATTSSYFGWVVDWDCRRPSPGARTRQRRARAAVLLHTDGRPANRLQHR